MTTAAAMHDYANDGFSQPPSKPKRMHSPRGYPRLTRTRVAPRLVLLYAESIEAGGSRAVGSSTNGVTHIAARPSASYTYKQTCTQSTIATLTGVVRRPLERSTRTHNIAPRCENLNEIVRECAKAAAGAARRGFRSLCLRLRNTRWAEASPSCDNHAIGPRSVRASRRVCSLTI